VIAGGRLRLAPVPEVGAAKRDPRTALAFLTDFDDNSVDARQSDEPGAAAVDQPASGPAAPGTTDLGDLVASLPWYHTIEMPGGVVSRGMFDHRPLVPHYGIPPTLAGLRCLDVACSNGFWAFEFERRGGDVTAVDIASWSDWDLPTGAPVPFAAAPDTGDGDGDGSPTPSAADPFTVARDALGSHVRRVQQNLYTLDPDALGRFEFVHAGDVLVHLARPLDALRALRRVTADGGTALLADVFDPHLSDPALTRYLGGFNGHEWWMPGLGCLVQMAYDAGFSAIEVVTVYNLAAWDQPEGHWRAVLRARA